MTHELASALNARKFRLTLDISRLEAYTGTSRRSSMVRPKKKSHRIPCRKKYKIEKKIREHHRKEKKAAKKRSHPRRTKDPGIPNQFPFKEELLKEAEERKRRKIEEANAKRKQKRIGIKSLARVQEDASRRNETFEKMKADEGVSSGGGSYSDASKKAYYKEFRKVVNAADVVLEVLDARDPMGCRCPQVEEAVVACGNQKRLVLVLNKIDLVPTKNVELWLKHLRNEFPTVAFKASTQTQKQHLSQSKVATSLAPTSLLSSKQCLGADTLMKLLANYCRSAGIRTSIRVGVVGFPNVGKSSLINSLKRTKVCGVGATPGVTKTMQEIQLDKHVRLIDSPGIVLASRFDQATAVLRNCIKIETVPDPIAPVEAILRRCPKDQMMTRYGIPTFVDVHDFVSHLARRMGKLKKGGVPDVDAAARAVLKDWNTGQIKFYTHPPEARSLPTHLSAEVVTQWSKEFDWKSLEAEEKENVLGEVDGTSEGMVLEASQPVDAMSTEKADSTPTVDDLENEDSIVPELMDEEEAMTVKAQLRETRKSKAKQQTLSKRDRRRDDALSKLNPQTNKIIKKSVKEKKRSKRKFEKVVDKLGESTEALSLSAKKSEAYSFEEHFKF
ncbi:guanine nucleotide-binding protein-like 3 homolog isoform X2 [Oscarella lobularis]|uniref:guanine nucleotide-binding protein-like 3 homolog isoform X2 n=1 Tax=Oscarella lobularis TaxID=121494 RepID=UPI003313E838